MTASKYPTVRTIGGLRSALECFSDDCPLLVPVEVIYTFSAQHGGSIELFVLDGDLDMDRKPGDPVECGMCSGGPLVNPDCPIHGGREEP